MHSNASNAGSPPNGGTRVTSSIGEPQCEHNAQSRSTPLVGGCSISQSLFDGYVSQRTLRVSVPDPKQKEIHIDRAGRQAGASSWSEISPGCHFKGPTVDLTLPIVIPHPI
jgi:hypothetical protein